MPVIERSWTAGIPTMFAQEVVHGIVRGLFDLAVLEVVELGLERIELEELIFVIGEPMANRGPRGKRSPFFE
jgi:hypothetical protein